MENSLKRYYYYRCTCVNKKRRQSCSIKEVSAERIENYILENLERISLDRNYIENFVFILSHNLNTPSKERIELSKVCSKFFVEIVISILKFFLSTLATLFYLTSFANCLSQNEIKSDQKRCNVYSENFKNFWLGKAPTYSTKVRQGEKSAR